MGRNAAARGAVLTDHQGVGNSGCLPSSSPRDRRGISDLAVEGRQHALHVGHDGLDLDNEERPGRGVPGEDVDGSALPADRERCLGQCLPTRGAKDLEHLLDDGRVIGVKESIRGFAMPIHPQDQPRIERRDHPLERVQSDATCAASLDSGHERLRDSRSGGQVELPPPSPNSQRPNDPADANGIHPRRITDHAYRPVAGIESALG